MSVNTTATGYTADTSFYTNIFNDFDEHVPALLWPHSVPVYARMRRDPQIAAVLAAYTLPIRRAQWAIDPTGCRPEVVQLVADDLDLAVNGEDRVGSARRRGVHWHDHIRTAMLSLAYGHMLFEPVYDTSSGQARLVGLYERLPQTIGAFNVDRNGLLTSIEQKPPIGVKSIVLKPEQIQLYTHDREGAAYMGQSLLRPSYGVWLLKQEMLKVLATANKRFGVGVPVVKAPTGAQPNQIAEAQRLATQWNGGANAGVGLPAGFSVDIQGITGSVPDTKAFIEYLDQQMSRSTLTGLLDLGNTPNGSRALGDTFLDLLMMSLQSIADQLAEQLTAQTVMNLVTFNFGEDEAVPRVVCGEIGAQHAVTADTLNALLSSGALSTDPQLEAWVRREWKLPERDPDAPTVTPSQAGQVLTQLSPNPPQVDDATGVTASRRPFEVSAAADGVLRRNLTDVEVAAATDFEEVQGQWDDALEQIVEAWGAITTAQMAALMAQLKEIVASGDTARLAELTAPTEEAAALLQEFMVALAADAVVGATDEARKQDVSVPDVEADEDRLSGAAVALVAFLGTGLATSVGRAALQHWQSGAKPAEVMKAVEQQISELTDSSLREQLGAGLTVAQNVGREAVFLAAPEGKYFASEVLDKGTCSKCRAIDGHQFADLEEAQSAYAAGGYEQCEGRLRCRGIIVTRWEN